MTLDNIRAVIFDVDGTLYPGGIAKYLILGDIWRCLWSYKERQVRKSMKSRDYMTGENYYDNFFSGLSKKTGKDASVMREWYFSRYMPLMVRVIGKNCKARPQVNEALKALKDKGMKILVYSDYTMSKEKIEALGIDSSVFDKFYSAEEMGALKPQTRPFLQICQENGLDAATTLMVGDKVTSDGGALDAGLQFVCIDGKSCKNVDRNKYDIVPWDDFVSICKK